MRDEKQTKSQENTASSLSLIPHPSSLIPRVVPLGDQAVLAYFPDETAAINFAAAVRSTATPWLQDIVPAYVSVGILFDADLIGTNDVIEWLNGFTASRRRWLPPQPGTQHGADQC